MNTKSKSPSSAKLILKGCLISIGIIVGLFSLIIIFSVIAFSDETKEKYDSANKEFNAKNYEKALSLVNESIKIDSINTNPDFFILRGKIAKSQGDSIGFKNDFDKALSSIKNDTLRYKQIMDLYDWSNSSQDTAYSKELLYKSLGVFIIRDSTNFSNSYIRVHTQLLNLKDTIAAINVLKTLSDSLEAPTVLNRLGIYHSNKNDTRKAIEYYQRAIELDSTNGIYYNNIGIAFEKLQNKKLAIENYKLGVKFKNDDACRNLREITAITKYTKKSRCWDGSSSYATGRGACSHHGGVKRVEYEPYKEYILNYNCK